MSRDRTPMPAPAAPATGRGRTRRARCSGSGPWPVWYADPAIPGNPALWSAPARGARALTAKTEPATASLGESKLSLKRYFSVHLLKATFWHGHRKSRNRPCSDYVGALHHRLSRKTGETGHPRHQRSRRRKDPDRGRHSARHQGRAACDPRQWQVAITGAFGARRSGPQRGQRESRDDSQLGTINMPANERTWTAERLELLKNRFEAGLSCRQIADDIGVSRNAVIGKLSRLNLTRDGEVRPPPRKRAAKGQRPKTVPRLHQMLKALYGEPQPAADDEPIHNGHCCSLFELSDQRCRCPISTPGLADFCFCGNTPLEGLPYCAGQ